MMPLSDCVEFEDAEGSSSSDMDEYESEDELGDMFCSPRQQHRKKPTPAKTSGAGKSQAKSKNTPPAVSSKPRPAKPPVADKPVTSSGKKPSVPATTGNSDVGSFLGMKEYMDAMDQELAKTTVGKSFVREGDEV